MARSADPVTPAAYSGSCKHINGSSANVVPANGVKAGCKFDAQISGPPRSIHEKANALLSTLHPIETWLLGEDSA